VVRIDDQPTVSDEFLDDIFQLTLLETERLHSLHGGVLDLADIGQVVAEAAIIPLSAIIAKGSKDSAVPLQKLCDEFVEGIKKVVRDQQ
jgi:hypothetical protein